MNIIGLIGIIIGIAFLIFAAMKGYETIYVIIPVVVLIALTNGLDITTSWVTTTMEGAAQYFTVLAPLLIAGMLFAGIFSISGAAKAIALGLLKFFEKIFKPKAGKEVNTGIWVTVVVITVVSSFFAYVGMDGMVVIVTIYPIALQMLKRYNVPRRCLPVLFYMNIWSMALPYSVGTTNVVTSQILGTDLGCAAVPAIIGAVVTLILELIYVTTYMKRIARSGEGFQAMPEYDMEMDESVKLPNFILAVIPFVLIFVLALVLKWNMSICLIIGTVVEILLFIPQLKATARIKNVKFMDVLKENMNHQAVFGVQITCIVVLLVGYSAVIRETPVFNSLITAMTTGSGVTLYIMCAIAMMIAVLMCVNPVAGMLTNLGVIAPYFIEAGVPAAAVHRMSIVASTVFDSLPTAAGIMLAHKLTGVKMKDGYGPVFVVTVCFTFLNMVIVTTLSALGVGV
ncbi:MAG: GntP family permease [Lachnospiraceae bacterium]|nr:GntP family permease [Lachnospiraceae bacterium]